MKTRLLHLLVFLAFSPVLAQQGKQAQPLTIAECVNVFDPARVESTSVGYQYWFVDKNFLDGRTIKMSVVDPHKATHAPHRHPQDEFFFVLEGKAEFFLDRTTRTAGPYTSFYCPPNSEHGIRNAGDAVVKYLVIEKYGTAPSTPTLQGTSKPKTIADCVNVFDPARVESTSVGYQYWFVDKTFLDGRTLKMSVVAPHKATHAPHRHPEDEFFFVLQGTAEFYLDGKTRSAGPYANFYCPPNSEHGIRNVGNAELKYLVIKKYPKP